MDLNESLLVTKQNDRRAVCTAIEFIGVLMERRESRAKKRQKIAKKDCVFISGSNSCVPGNLVLSQRNED